MREIERDKLGEGRKYVLDREKETEREETKKRRRRRLRKKRTEV